jgi:cyclin-dependent kinase 7
MANSPLILRGAAEVNGAAKQSKLASNAASSNGATPELAQASNGGARDVAEQMNEDEKSKYVKGKASAIHEK